MHETMNACFDIISCHILYACSKFKTNEPLSKKKFSFLFLLKSSENAVTAFCILADNMPLHITHE